jgi:hypothetical protein
MEGMGNLLIKGRKWRAHPLVRFLLFPYLAILVFSLLRLREFLPLGFYSWGLIFAGGLSLLAVAGVSTRGSWSRNRWRFPLWMAMVLGVFFVFSRPGGFRAYDQALFQRLAPTSSSIVIGGRAVRTAMSAKAALQSSCKEVAHFVACSEALFDRPELRTEVGQVLVLAIQTEKLIKFRKSAGRTRAEADRAVMLGLLESSVLRLETLRRLDREPHFPLDRVWAMPDHSLVAYQNAKMRAIIIARLKEHIPLMVKELRKAPKDARSPAKDSEVAGRIAKLETRFAKASL